MNQARVVVMVMVMVTDCVQGSHSLGYKIFRTFPKVSRTPEAFFQDLSHANDV